MNKVTSPFLPYDYLNHCPVRYQRRPTCNININKTRKADKFSTDLHDNNQQYQLVQFVSSNISRQLSALLG